MLRWIARSVAASRSEGFRSSDFWDVRKHVPPKENLAEPAVRKNIARTIRRPARRIHLAMGPDRQFPAPTTILEIADQLLGRLELRAGRLVAG